MEEVRARELVGAGKLHEAEQLCRQLLSHKSRNDNVLSMLGVIAFRTGRLTEAVEYFSKAAAIDPRNEQHALDLATTLQQSGRADEATAAYRKALSEFPTSANIINDAANGLMALGHFREAAETYRRALGSGRPEIHNNLGNALQRDRRFAEAIESYRNAIRIKPDYFEPHFNLANALSETGEFAQAIQILNRTLELRPDLPEAYLLLGIIFGNLNDDAKAADAFRQALRLRPAFAQAELELAKVLLRNDRLDDAIAALNRCAALDPNLNELFIYLGHALRERGDHLEAFKWNQRARVSDDSLTASTFLFALNYEDSIDAKAVLKYHRDWAARFAAPLAAEIKPLEIDRSPSRRLRIGYVSPTFRDHPVGRFMQPLLANHNRESFEIHCFNDLRKPDRFTASLRAQADVWMDTGSLTDAALADVIRDKKIDILVDLAMHSPNSRMLTFARRPAPVQVTYLAYAGTTGVPTMDYRLTDPYLDPSPDNDGAYSEKTWRLPRTYWCYSAPPEAPEVSAAPVERVGYVTFGCLSNFSKVTEPTLAAWAQILRATPGSHLIMHTPAGEHRKKLLARFAAEGIDADRIRFIARGPAETYFATYRDIDICFDTAGYGGGTTTLDSLWMGVPVVTLAGSRAIGRGGVSILSNLQLQDLIATDAGAYVAIARQLAEDRVRLVDLRKCLRSRMVASPLMDARGFTKDLEAAMRQMWELAAAGVSC